MKWWDRIRFAGKLERDNIDFKQQLVNVNNRLWEALYGFLGPGIKLTKDSNITDYIENGYNSNADLFSIVNKLGTMGAKIPLVPYKGENESDEDPYNDFFDSDITDITEFEHRRYWFVFGYTTGNALVYIPYYEAGLNKGKPFSWDMIPTQHVEIESGGWRQPVKYYKIDLEQRIRLDPKFVWHTRFFPNLEFEGGANFMGISPIKVAANIINTQNGGYEIMASTFSRGHPSSIIYNESLPASDSSREFQNRLDAAWERKYGKNRMDKSGKPVFMSGKVGVAELGFRNLNDLKILEASEHGLRVYCRVLSVPSMPFNDPEGTTYNNMIEATKAIYTNRLIPDLELYVQGVNKRFQSMGIEYRPDYSGIECLQDDKKEQSEWLQTAYNNGWFTGDECLERLGEEPTGLPEMQRRYVSFGKQPLDEMNVRIPDIEETEKFLKQHDIKDYV